MKMKIIISPAKKIDSSKNRNNIPYSEPYFLDKSIELVNILKDFSPTELSRLMGVSANLGLLNADRYLSWSLPFNYDNAKQAILSFKGSVYSAMNPEDFNKTDFDFAQKHLRILSGLYGILKPLDLVQAYRLEMGTKFKTYKSKNLYHFWGDSLTEHMTKEIVRDKDTFLVNLASNEYSKSLNLKELGVPIVTPVFKDFKDGKLKVISFFAKKARGNMCRYIIKNKINSYKKLVDFSEEGYIFDKDISSNSEFIFVR